MTEVAQLIEILAKGDERVALVAGFDVVKASRSYDFLEAPIVQKIVNESPSNYQKWKEPQILASKCASSSKANQTRLG